MRRFQGFFLYLLLFLVVIRDLYGVLRVQRGLIWVRTVDQFSLDLSEKFLGRSAVGISVDFIPLIWAHCLLRLGVFLHLRWVERAIVFKLRISYGITHFLDVLLCPLRFHGRTLHLLPWGLIILERRRQVICTFWGALTWPEFMRIESSWGWGFCELSHCTLAHLLISGCRLLPAPSGWPEPGLNHLIVCVSGVL